MAEETLRVKWKEKCWNESNWHDNKPELYHHEVKVTIQDGKIAEVCKHVLVESSFGIDNSWWSSAKMKNEKERKESIQNGLRMFWNCADNGKKIRLLDLIDETERNKYFEIVYVPK